LMPFWSINGLMANIGIVMAFRQSIVRHFPRGTRIVLGVFKGQIFAL